MTLLVEPYLEAIGAIGAKNAVSSKTLAKGLQTNTRGLYSMIETERNLGRPICVATGGGFFLPDESGARHDVSCTANRLRQKAQTMLRTADAMEEGEKE
jgi:predicted DNA-binding transcriptional regulator YafY